MSALLKESVACSRRTSILSDTLATSCSRCTFLASFSLLCPGLLSGLIERPLLIESRLVRLHSIFSIPQRHYQQMTHLRRYYYHRSTAFSHISPPSNATPPRQIAFHPSICIYFKVLYSARSVRKSSLVTFEYYILSHVQSSLNVKWSRYNGVWIQLWCACFKCSL